MSKRLSFIKSSLLSSAITCFVISGTSCAQATPYYIATSTELEIKFWKVDTAQRSYKQVALWRVPGTLGIRSISAFPTSRKLLVSTASAGNSKIFSVSIARGGKVSSVDHNWVGYGYPLISPSERTVAIVGWDGCHGYIDMRKNKRDSELTRFALSEYDGVGAWTVGEHSRLGIHGVASWIKQQEQIKPFKVTRYIWKGERVTESLQFRLPIDDFGTPLSVGVALCSDGSFFRVNKSTITRISGNTRTVTEKTIARNGWNSVLGIGPGPYSNGLALIRSDTGATVILSAGGEAFSVSSPHNKINPLSVGITPAINTTGNGEVAMAAIDGIRIGRWVGTRFYQTLLIPGKHFKEIEYLGSAHR